MLALRVQTGLMGGNYSRDSSGPEEAYQPVKAGGAWQPGLAEFSVRRDMGTEAGLYRHANCQGLLTPQVLPRMREVPSIFQVALLCLGSMILGRHLTRCRVSGSK